MVKWRIERRTVSNRYKSVVRHFVTDGRRGRNYETKAAALAVKRALEGKGEPGGWGTREAAEITGRLF